MSIDNFCNKTVTVKRKASNTGNKVEGWIDVNTVLKCSLYPVNSRDGNSLGQRTSYIVSKETHALYCLDTDIKIDDKVIENKGGYEYIVKRIKRWIDYLEVLLCEVG